MNDKMEELAKKGQKEELANNNVSHAAFKR